MTSAGVPCRAGSTGATGAAGSAGRIRPRRVRGRLARALAVRRRDDVLVVLMAVVRLRVRRRRRPDPTNGFVFDPVAWQIQTLLCPCFLGVDDSPFEPLDDFAFELLGDLAFELLDDVRFGALDDFGLLDAFGFAGALLLFRGAGCLPGGRRLRRASLLGPLALRAALRRLPAGRGLWPRSDCCAGCACPAPLPFPCSD